MSDTPDDTADAPSAPIDTSADISAPGAGDEVDEPLDLADTPVEQEVLDGPTAADLCERPADDGAGREGAPVDVKEPVDLGEIPDEADVAVEAPLHGQEGDVVDLGHDAAADRTEEAETVEADDLVGTVEREPDVIGRAGSDSPTARAGEDLTQPVEDESVAREAPPADLAGQRTEADGLTLTESISETHGVDDEDTGLETDPVIDEQGSEVDEGRHASASDVTVLEPDPTVDELTTAARDHARPIEELRAEYDADLRDAWGSSVPTEGEPGGGEVAAARESHDQTDRAGDFGNSPDNEALMSALADKGLSLEPVELFDFSDNPILGYRESAPAEDIAYAVTAWNDQVAPGIAAGATREDFAAYDREHGLEGHRQLAGVYDYMLGGDAIKSGGERAGGLFDVTGGRHRLQQACLNGVSYLPVRK